MPGKITIKVTKGLLAGKVYEYEEKTRIFIGRQGDCGIVLPENTVSRYHCILEITPPEVKLQDFGSLNGTFLNGKKIGQRERGREPEDVNIEGREIEGREEYILHDGDVLGLGSRCELKLGIETAVTLRCAICNAELAPDGEDGATVPEDAGLVRLNSQRDRICESCFQNERQAEMEREAAQKKVKKVAERAEAERMARQFAEEFELKIKQNRTKDCAGCGKKFTPADDDNNLCPDCLADRAKMVDAVLRDMLGGMLGTRPGEARSGSPIEGFEKIKLLGKGAMGEVWKVKEISSGTYYALKTMLPEVKANDTMKALFLREAEIGKYLDHQNVIATYQTGCSNGIFYILMDLCEGGSVEDLMDQNGGKLPLETATRIVLQLLSGLSYVHSASIGTGIQAGLWKGTKDVHGIVHRDLKPGNIFLSDRSEKAVVKIADLGMAKAFDTAGLSRATQTGTVMGTPVFMPRQQAINFKYAKPEVDVWAAAATYYNMLTGKFPKNFRRGKNVWEIIVTESAVPILKRNGNIPGKLAEVIDQALQEQPVIGYTVAASLREDIVSALPSHVRSAVKEVI